MSPQDNLSPQESRAVFWRVKARALTSPLTILRLILVASLATAGWFLTKSIVGEEGTLLGFIITAIAAEFLLAPLRNRVEAPLLTEETAKIIASRAPRP